MSVILQFVGILWSPMGFKIQNASQSPFPSPSVSYSQTCRSSSHSYVSISIWKQFISFILQQEEPTTPKKKTSCLMCVQSHRLCIEWILNRLGLAFRTKCDRIRSSATLIEIQIQND